MIMNIKKYKNIFIFFVIFILVLSFTLFFLPVNVDEVWEFGYGYNIANGLIVYRDFNMVVTPLYAFIISLFVKIFGPYLLSANIFNALVLTIMFFILYKMLGYKSFILIPLIMMFSYPTYNNLLMLLFFLFIYIKRLDISNKNKVIFSSLIISFMFLTKQSVGIVFFLLEFFLSKEKKLYLTVFFIPVLILIIYLLINNALYQFIDYSFLGLFDFGTRNSNINPAMLSTVSICILLYLLYINYNRIDIIYIAAYQVVAVPIFDLFHIVMGVIVFLFICLDIYYKKILNYHIIIFTTILTILLIITNYNSNKIVLDNNYLFLKNVDNSIFVLIDRTSNKINKYKNNYDKIYNLTRYSYFVKLYNGDTIDKFDMTLNGNMGYKGYNKYIKDIDKYCKDKKCLFIISPAIENNYMQKNYEINDYITNNYNMIDNDYSLGYDIYSN